ncbi:tol-pal system protein YbgF [Saezia sanguinis]|uniref:tol-pal system protein YbgF n=1 Tax=Saezia sanguinis TaxID=1965230 RepID=UPI0030349DDE
MHTTFSLRLRICLVLALMLGPLGAAQAFSDDEARKAILELRQRMDTQRATSENQANSILALSSQIQELRSEIAVLRGRIEELERSARTQSEQTQPRDVAVDGKSFTAQPQEISDYEAGMEKLRQADYAGAVTLFQSFILRWPKSGYLDSVNFWLGNAQYGTKQYADAVKSFTALVDASPNHVRTPDALLAIANCQVELKNTRAARAALERLVQSYPQTEAANEARKRLAQIR